MTTTIAINGFGRIGRLVLRAVFEGNAPDFKVAAINDLADADRLAHLLKYDSVHGRFPGEVSSLGDSLIINDQTIPTFKERDPAALPWGELGIDIAMECTGFFLTEDLAGKHLQAGAKRVLISAPAKDAVKTVVYGINHDVINKDDRIISNASCTTNALAPLIQTLDKAFGINSGIMTTIHAYTGGQNLADGIHKDPYRGRAAALSMIPTSTGAAKAIGKVIPHLNGKLHGMSLRVPTPNVSAVDLTVSVKNNASADTVRAAFLAASSGPLKGVMAYIEDKTVSIDFNHDPHSSSFVADQVFTTDDNMIRVFSWYDNEWGFSNRMLDTARVMSALL
ncbi:MAG: type I glyceraldehyde-3-phosphate dehydrogenase [Robiginitomaculum sp.]